MKAWGQQPEYITYTVPASESCRHFVCKGQHCFTAGRKLCRAMSPNCSTRSEEAPAQEDQSGFVPQGSGLAGSLFLCRGEHQGRAPHHRLSEGIQGFIKLLTLLLHSSGIHTRMYKTKYQHCHQACKDLLLGGICAAKLHSSLPRALSCAVSHTGQGCGCSPEQSALPDPAWSREAGPDDLQRSCDSVTLDTFIKKFQGNFPITSLVYYLLIHLCSLVCGLASLI